jgi:hypothetical protein
LQYMTFSMTNRIVHRLMEARMQSKQDRRDKSKEWLKLQPQSSSFSSVPWSGPAYMLILAQWTITKIWMLSLNYFRFNAATFPYKFMELSYLLQDEPGVVLGAFDGGHGTRKWAPGCR